jgi:hypothetical protein
MADDLCKVRSAAGVMGACLVLLIACQRRQLCGARRTASESWL